VGVFVLKKEPFLFGIQRLPFTVWIATLHSLVTFCTKQIIGMAMTDIAIRLQELTGYE